MEEDVHDTEIDFVTVSISPKDFLQTDGTSDERGVANEATGLAEHTDDETVEKEKLNSISSYLDNKDGDGTFVGDYFLKDNIGSTAQEKQACKGGSVLQIDCQGQGETKSCMDFVNVKNDSLADGCSNLAGDISSATSANEDKESSECGTLKNHSYEEENNTSLDRQTANNCMTSISDLASVAALKEQYKVSADIELNYSQLQKIDFERGTLVNTRKEILANAVHSLNCCDKVQNNCFSQAENPEDALKSMSSVETIFDSEHKKLDGKVYSMNNADKQYHSTIISPQDNPGDVAQSGTVVETLVDSEEGKPHEQVYSMHNIDKQLNSINVAPQGSVGSLKSTDFESSSSSDNSSDTESSSSSSSESSESSSE